GGGWGVPETHLHSFPSFPGGRAERPIAWGFFSPPPPNHPRSSSCPPKTSCPPYFKEKSPSTSAVSCPTVPTFEQCTNERQSSSTGSSRARSPPTSPWNSPPSSSW